MRILNLYSDDDGETHFREIEIECADQRPYGSLSNFLARHRHSGCELLLAQAQLFAADPYAFATNIAWQRQPGHLPLPVALRLEAELDEAAHRLRTHHWLLACCRPSIYRGYSSRIESRANHRIFTGRRASAFFKANPN